MDDAIDRSFDGSLTPVYYATALTLAAEALYLIAFGVVLFPSGSIAGKVLWSFTCGIAMGAIVGVATIVLRPLCRDRKSQLLVPAVVMAFVGSYCAFICSQIDVHFNFFGGGENTGIFILSGVIPSIIGGLLYGWLLDRAPA